MIFERAAKPYLTLATTLPSTLRGSQGLGSTGKSHRRKRGIIHTSDGFIYVDESRKHKPKSCHVHPPRSKGVQSPIDPTYYSTHPDWQAHSLHSNNPDANVHPELVTPTLTECPKEPLHPVGPAPRVLPQERVSSSAAKHQRISEDTLLKSIGFVKPDNSFTTWTFSVLGRYPSPSLIAIQKLIQERQPQCEQQNPIKHHCHQNPPTVIYGTWTLVTALAQPSAVSSTLSSWSIAQADTDSSIPYRT